MWWLREPRRLFEGSLRIKSWTGRKKKSKFEDQFQGQTSLMNVPGVVDSSRQAARGGMKSEQL